MQKEEKESVSTIKLKDKIKKIPLHVKVTSGIICFMIACFVVVFCMINQRLSMINHDFTSPTISPKDEVFDDDTKEYGDAWAVNTYPPEGTLNPSAVPTAVVTEAPVPVSEWPDDIEPLKDSNVINILLIGEDKRPGETSCRSDTMIVLTINKNTNAVKLTSFMRDSYVQIPGYSDNKLNSAYAHGGVSLLDRTLTKNFGITIDANVAIDFNDFVDIIDTLGGVTISITDKEASYLNKKGYSVSAGSVDMSGKLALEYSRIRKIDSDFYRTARQRKVLTTLFSNFKDKSLVELYSISDDILPLITTDMSNSEILGYLKYIVSMNLDGLESYRIPADGTCSNGWVRRMSVVRLDLTANREKLKSYLYE